MDDDEFQRWESTLRRMFGAAVAMGAEPETAKTMALGARRLYDALIEQGFAPDEALVITAANQHRPQANATR